MLKPFLPCGGKGRRSGRERGSENGSHVIRLGATAWQAVKDVDCYRGRPHAPLRRPKVAHAVHNEGRQRRAAVAQKTRRPRSKRVLPPRTAAAPPQAARRPSAPPLPATKTARAPPRALRAAHDAQKGGARRARRDDERRNVPLPAPRRHKRVARFLVAKLARARALARVRRNVRALATSRISRAARANTSAALSAAPRPARSTPLREQKRRRRGNKAAGLYAVRGGNGRASGGPTSQAAAKSVPLVWSTTRVVAMSIST